MAAIHASIEVDVPLEFADLEWSEFLLKSMLSGYTRGLTDIEPLIGEEVAHAQATLERDLEKYRVFVLDRCEKMQCRPR